MYGKMSQKHERSFKPKKIISNYMHEFAAESEAEKLKYEGRLSESLTYQNLRQNKKRVLNTLF